MALLAGKRAVVTGAASGNGRAIACAFAREGAHVVVADITEEPREGGEATLALITGEIGGTGQFVHCDVTKTDDLEAAIDAAEVQGGIDIMVNNAGILMKQGVLEATEAGFQRMIDVNVRGPFFGTQIAAKRMRARGAGSIINIGSIAGVRGTSGYATYNLCKGAIRMLSSSSADELGPLGIRVNAVFPGIMRTQMNIEDDPVIGTDVGEGYLDLIPARRWGEAGDVADACVYLASDMARYVYGAALTVDGGYLRL
ncbi:MAG: SDR family oxidoreductase [Pseudomonadota bacterium]